MKKFLALFLAMAMLVTVVPMTVMAAGAIADSLTGTDMFGLSYTYAANKANTETGSDFSEMPKITAVGTGVKGGNKLFGEEVPVVEYAAGTSIAEKLSDGYYFTYGEKAWSEEKGVKINGETIGVTKNAPADSTANMVHFTEEGSGIEFNWTEKQTVARLHLWAWPADAIDGYRLEYKKTADDAEWTPVKSGSLDYDAGASNSAPNSTFYQIILYKPVQAVALRFVITSFTEEYKDNGVYITEAVPRSTNDINLTAMGPLEDADQALAATTDTASRTPYTFRTVYTNKATPKTNDGSSRLQNWYTSAGIPALGTDVAAMTGNDFITNKTTSSTGKEIYTQPYYAVDFGTVKQRINRLKFFFHLHPGNVVKGVEVYCSDDNSAYSAVTGDTIATEIPSTWERVYEEEPEDRSITNYAQQTNYIINISGAPEARYWMIRFVIPESTEYVSSNGAVIRPVAMYSMPEYASGDDEKLNDDIRMTWPEWQKDTSNGASKVKDTHFLKFSKADTGIEWNFDDAKTVKAVDLWTWPAYAIKEYELWYDDGGEWKKATADDATFNPGNKDLGDTTTGASAATEATFWNSIVLDEAVTTNKLKFVIKSLTSPSYGAYIAEADVRETNNINLIALDTENNADMNYSIYASTYKTSSRGSQAGESFRGWPEGYTVSAKDGDFSHAVWFLYTRHAINRVTLNIAKGTVNKFGVYSSNTSWSDTTDVTKWTEVATVTGSFEGSVTVDIKDAQPAEYWMVKVLDAVDGTELNVTGLYELGEGELNEDYVDGTVSEGNVVTLSLDKLDTFFEGEKEGDAKVFFALYSGNSLVDLEIVGVNLANIENRAEYAVYTVPEDKGEELKLKAFVWRSETGLVPLSTEISFN